jgi:hypothetical protein
MSCEVCGSTMNLLEHHISYDPEIKQILCRKHHAELHALNRRDRKPYTLYLSPRTNSSHIPDVIIQNLQIEDKEIHFSVAPDLVLLYNPNRVSNVKQNLQLLLARICLQEGDINTAQMIINEDV